VDESGQRGQGVVEPGVIRGQHGEGGVLDGQQAAQVVAAVLLRVAHRMPTTRASAVVAAVTAVRAILPFMTRTSCRHAHRLIPAAAVGAAAASHVSSQGSAHLYAEPGLQTGGPEAAVRQDGRDPGRDPTRPPGRMSFGFTGP
jgi:hypothetical protein